MRGLIAVYRLLLFACPPGVRRELGPDLEAAFAHSLRLEWRRRGAPGRAIACARGFADLLAFALKAHWHRWGTAPQEPHVTRAIDRRRPLVFSRDVRGTLRLLRAQPAMSATIVAMLALGIGATTAIFSVVYGVLIRPLPFPEADRIVQIWGSLPDRGWARASLTEANFWDLRDRNRTFDEMGALSSTAFTLTGLQEPLRVSAAAVTVGFFRTLGVTCVAGRLFEPGEDLPGSPDRVMLAHGFWERRFGRDPSVVGRSLTLDGRSYTIVGVLPPGSPWLDIGEVFVPFIRRPDANRGSFEYAGIGRLRKGVSIESALADLGVISKQLEAEYPDSNKGLGVTMAPAREWIASDNLRRTLWILLGAVGLLLAIACVNVTNLLLARANSRARESAVRSALGASRADLIRERLTESLLYGITGSILGLFVAQGMLALLRSMDPGGIPRLAEIDLNVWVLGFAAAAAILVGVATGVIPALSLPFDNLVNALRPSQRGAGGHGNHRLRNLLIVAEVAISLVLLVGAGLLVRSLVNVMSVDRGFQTENRLLVSISIPRSLGPERMAQTVGELLSRVRALPSVLAAAAVSGRPLARSSTGLGLGALGAPESPGAPVPWATWRIVTADYFRVMGVPLLTGRVFTEQEEASGRPIRDRVVISKRVADLLWPGQNPIGRTALLWKGQGDQRAEVIGVVGDMRERGLEADPTLAVYLSAAGSMATSSLQLAVHAKGRPEEAIASIRSVVSSVNPNFPISNVRTMDDVVWSSLATRRFTMVLLVTFAGLALLLALAGVYGVLAYAIGRRTSEIGVRLALGAQPGRVLGLVVAQGMQPVIVGAAIGLVAAFWLSRVIATLLFELEPRDPATYAAVLGVLLAVAAVACYVPARRVLGVDPASALRVE